MIEYPYLKWIIRINFDLWQWIEYVKSINILKICLKRIHYAHNNSEIYIYMYTFSTRHRYL